MERTILLTPRMLCSVSVSGATWRTVPDLRRTNPGMERSGPTLTALRRAAGPGGSGAGGAPAAAAERLCCWTASRYICALACVCMYLVSECAPTRRVPSTSPSLAGWPVKGRERDAGAATKITCLGSYSGPQASLVFCRWAVTSWPASLGWPSWCNPGGQPSLLRRASSRAQPVPRGQNTCSPA